MKEVYEVIFNFSYEVVEVVNKRKKKNVEIHHEIHHETERGYYLLANSPEAAELEAMSRYSFLNEKYKVGDICYYFFKNIKILSASFQTEKMPNLSLNSLSSYLSADDFIEFLKERGVNSLNVTLK